MAVESATKDIQVTVSKNLSTTTIQGVKVEVNPDSNVVVYTNDGVQTKPAAASGEAAAKGTQISISEVAPSRMAAASNAIVGTKNQKPRVVSMFSQAPG